MHPPFGTWALWFQEKKKNKKGKCCKMPKNPKARFQKRGVAGKSCSGFPPVLLNVSPKEGISLGWMVYERCQRRHFKLNTLLYYGLQP